MSCGWSVGVLMSSKSLKLVTFQTYRLKAKVPKQRAAHLPWSCGGRTLVGRQWSGAEWSQIPVSSSGVKWSVGRAMTRPPPHPMTAAGACSHWTTPCHLYALLPIRKMKNMFQSTMPSFPFLHTLTKLTKTTMWILKYITVSFSGVSSQPVFVTVHSSPAE